MNASENKQLLQTIYAELSQGNSAPLVESMAEDVRWTITGNTAWSGTYQGKQAVLGELLGPLRARFAGRYRATAQRFIAEGDQVVVEVQGQVTTKTGLPYNNRYCFIYRLVDGKVLELTEYLDTELVTAALGMRDQAPA